jgi:hypothetical protein
MNLKSRKIGIGATLILGLILLLTPSTTEAGKIATITAGLVGKIVFFITYILSTIAGIGIAIEAWVLGFVLHINTQIINSPPVAVGFPVALSLANLALVFAIIVIAIMTILRVQTYGIKQTLWKLIVIAIAINFGLVIAGVILQFFDSLSFYFLNLVSPTAGGSGTGTVTQYNPFDGFASALAGAFQPQRTLVNPENADASVLGEIRLGSDIGGLITPITAGVFTVFALIFIQITLGALIVMLIIRYVYLGYLLILLPLAWASWIFPATKSHWDKWWHNFWNQAAFSPIVLFFLWVTIQTSYALYAGQAFDFGTSYTDPKAGGLIAAVAEFFRDLFTPIVSQFLNMAVLLGVMIGGLFAAKSMGIKFADYAAAMATGTAAAFGRWSARKGTQMGTAVARSERGKKLAETLQTREYGRFARLTGIAALGRQLGGGLQRIAVTGGEKAVAEAAKNIEHMTDDQVANAMSRFDAPTRWAALQRLQKNGTLGKVKNLHRYLGRDRAAEANRYNQGLLFQQIRQERGLELLDLIEEAEQARGTANEGAAREKLSKHLQTIANPGELAKMLVTNEAGLETTAAHLGTNMDKVKTMQEYLAKGVFEDFSGSGIAAVVKEAAKGEQLDVLKTIGERAIRNGVASTSRLSNSFKKYVISSPAAKSLGIDETSFGLRREDVRPPRATPPGGGATPTPGGGGHRGGGAPPRRSTIVEPPPEIGASARERLVRDEETGNMVTPEERERLREARERAAFEERRRQTPPAPPSPTAT